LGFGILLGSMAHAAHGPVDDERENVGQGDRDFMLMMIPHHQSAIDVARAELKYGKDARVRALAANVISAQQKEIDEITGWLAAPSH